jgi:hypothetical protein
MAAIPRKSMPPLMPMVLPSTGTKVRIVADAFIPWLWVELPNPPLPLNLRLATALGPSLFVHGDGRNPAIRSDDIGNRFRIEGAAEVDVIEAPGETLGYLARHQASLSELRLLGRVLHSETDLGGLSSTIAADRITPNSVEVSLAVSGSVPWNVAGPQPSIDFDYRIRLTFDPATGQVLFAVSAAHDGFPAHELFIESSGLVRFNRNYQPTFFARTTLVTATPSAAQAVAGASALGGVAFRQHWTVSGGFVP